MYSGNPLGLLSISFLVCLGAFVLSLSFSPLVIWGMKKRNVNFDHDYCNSFWLTIHSNFVQIWALFGLIAYVVFLLFLVGLQNTSGAIPFLFGSALFVVFGGFSFDFAAYIFFKLRKKNKTVS